MSHGIIRRVSGWLFRVSTGPHTDTLSRQLPCNGSGQLTPAIHSKTYLSNMRWTIWQQRYPHTSFNNLRMRDIRKFPSSLYCVAIL